MKLDKDKIKWVGWCRDLEENKDKVWGIIFLKNNTVPSFTSTYVTFWGRRGKSLQSKIQVLDKYEVEKLIRSKIEKKGYEEIDVNKLDDVSNRVIISKLLRK